MVEIIINGCAACGVNAAYVRKVQRYYGASEVTVTNTKYDKELSTLHLQLQESAGFDLSSFVPLIFNTDTLEVTKLREFAG